MFVKIKSDIGEILVIVDGKLVIRLSYTPDKYCLPWESEEYQGEYLELYLNNKLSLCRIYMIDNGLIYSSSGKKLTDLRMSISKNCQIHSNPDTGIMVSLENGIKN